MISRLLLPLTSTGPKHTELAMQQDEHALTVSMLCYQPPGPVMDGMSETTEQMLRAANILFEAALERLIAEVDPNTMREAGIAAIASGKDFLAQKLGLTPLN